MSQRERDNRPKAFSLLDPFTGRLIWKYPEEVITEVMRANRRAANAKKRSRLETDKEVITRIKQEHFDMYRRLMGDEKGNQLDQILKHLGSSRKYVDEVA